MLLDKILSPYIQNIDNGLYSFHFSRYIQREIVYISQFNEEEMAAFNFSLDESIQIKQHYRQILNEQTKLYKEEHPKSEEIRGNYVFSNLHAQDNEFDQALTEYLHAASHLNRNLFSKSSEDVTSPIIFYIQVLLKIGLLQERRMLYDAAIVSYSRAMEIIKRFFDFNFVKENFEELKILFQPYLCLSFLHAKRDHSLDAANSFMKKYKDLILDIAESESTAQELLIYQHNIRWAEMFMMRSQFKKAIDKYIKAINQFKYCDISESLAGLADACTALALKQWYEQKKLSINFPPESAYNVSDENLQKHFDKNVTLIIKSNQIDSLIDKALHLYVLASHAYRLSASPDKESLMLWKLAYVVGYGLNYMDSNLEQKDDINWLFRNLNTENHNKNPIRNGFAQIFGGSYSVHRNRLKNEIGVNDEKVLRWITPPLTQVLLVLGHFWHSYWGDGIDDEGKPAKMDETAFKMLDMGAFPMKAKILAQYLKARWYQTKTNNKAEAFRLYVKALENGQAYEGGLDSISLSLGMIYFHIWEIVKDNDLSEIKIHQEFKGDMQRYFSESHCRNRTKKYLTELLSRHHIDGINPKRFFTYMNKQYYLYNDFSDSYVNGVWAIEYGLVPVAQDMLKQINEDIL
ncbi:hypothetical protein [Candidatus Marithrix sp. Canyon 246]|uniref:hypothetical protein n=1 Tax=Candidatus Marithrix sp. Canyon 246 TaxID=1827136 RepID=UPI00084A1703|nr:hypothetical protein [Candidatus Marithrix sp. Canyon 246]